MGAVCAGPAELTGADLKDCVSNNSLSSNASLPSVQSCRRLRERRVASWAVSFERLLQDPLGVRYFSVSGEEPELVREKPGRTLRPADDVLRAPHPDMFKEQQLQLVGSPG
ncbi:hypothetical protein P7K49_005950 [Saguinus oedipus]|uniref:Uncharacterized protein n=1 Tax=Saguinus oedipus TaxID=9490 RepID=A0ABQ9W118_SAGOE|nr:hypothetical protein P7K49_005950 [Saguinus oedipus]